MSQLHRLAILSPVEALHLVDHDMGSLVLPIPAFRVDLDDKQHVAIQREKLRADLVCATLVVPLEGDRPRPGVFQLGYFTGRDSPEEAMPFVTAVLIGVVCPSAWRDLKQVAVSTCHRDLTDRICGQMLCGEDAGDEREFPNHLCELAAIHD